MQHDKEVSDVSPKEIEVNNGQRTFDMDKRRLWRGGVAKARMGGKHRQRNIEPESRVLLERVKRLVADL